MADVVVYQEPKPLSLTDVQGQVTLIQQIMKGVMKEGEHFGVIPGTGSKPTLLKPGAEKLCLTFRLAPTYEIREQKDLDHLTILSTCTLTHIPSGNVYGSGMGSCSTKEGKYAYRQAQRKCPFCGKEAIIKGKEEYGGGFICFKKKGGCGEKFADDDEAITKQEAGKMPNENLADTYNTVLKMSNKRALVAAVLNVTAASDIFTQDIEDMHHEQPTAASGPSPATPPPNAAVGVPVGECISVDQAIQLGDLLQSKPKGRTKEKLLANVGRQYGKTITSLQEIRKADYEDALAYAQGS